MQFYVSNYVGPELTDIAQLADLHRRDGGGAEAVEAAEHHAARGRPAGHVDHHVAALRRRDLHGLVPYLLLVIFVLLWGEASIKPRINAIGDALLPAALPTVPASGLVAARLMVPGLHNMIERIPPVVAAAGAVRGALRAELAERLGHGLPVRDHRHRARPARVAVAAWPNLRRHVQAAEVRAADHCLHARARLPDELLGHDLDARALRWPPPASPSRSSAPSSAGSACSSPAATPRPMRSSATCRW